MKKTVLLIPGLLALIACDTQGEVSLGDTGAADYEELGAEDLTLDWDNPDFRPEIDRWAPDGEPVAIPLGTSNAYDIQWGTWKGESNGDRLGIGLAATDLNGDGMTDLVAGSQYANGSGGGDGAAYMNRSTLGSGNHNVGGAKGRYYGPSGSNTGEVVGSGGDVDGNGQDDLVLGGRNYDNPDDNWKTNSGVAYIVQNFQKGSVTLEGSAIEIRGAKAYDFFGAGAGIVGDVNNDGYADVAVGATGADENGSGSGAVYLFYGPVTADTDASAADVTIAGAGAGDAAGARIRSLGDYDGDGVDDWMVGVRGAEDNGADAGAVYIFTDTTFPNNLGGADYVFYGNKAGSKAGAELIGAGDLDGDGYDDVLVGAIGHSNTGAVFLVRGNTGGYVNIGYASSEKFLGEKSGDQFGASLAVGDLNGDDVADIAVGSNRYANSDRGAVHAWYGPFDMDGMTAGANTADFKITGVAGGDRFGSSMQYVENVDQINRNVLAVGASSRGSNKGAVYLFKVD